jgi:hypothetical protein
VNHSFILPATTLCLVLAAASAAAGDLGALMAKGGEWEVTVSNGITPTTTQRICNRGGRSIADLAASRLKDCARKTINVSGGTAKIYAECTLDGDIDVTIRGTIAAVGDARFRGEGKMHMDSMPDGIVDDTPVAVSGSRLGPCRPGDAPM